MKIKNPLTRERVSNGLKYLGQFRPRIDHSSIITFSALLLILFIAFTIRIFPMRWEIQIGSMHLSEFDPYFQYRFTEYILKNGFISWVWPKQWIDLYRWHPQGANVATTGYPALPFTAAFFYKIISALGIGIGLMDFCALFPAIMGMLASLIIYFLGKDIGGKPVGLLAALFLALNPSFIQRTTLGFFDDETIGIFALLLFAFLFLRAIEEDRQLSSTVKYSLASGVVLGYFCSGWGAAFYPVDLTVLFVFVLILLKRYTQRLLLAYSLTFGLGLFMAINVPRLSPAYITTIAILPVAGVFVLLCFCEIFQVLKATKRRTIFVVLFLALFVGGFALLWQLGYMRGIAGKFISVIDPFTREASPLIESVAEHRVSAWGSIYYDLGIGIIFFAAGLFFILVNLNNKNLFLLIFGLTSLYFACSMVRLLVILAPAFSLLAAVGITGILKPFNTLLKEQPKIGMKRKYVLEHVGKEFSGAAVFLIFLIVMTNLAFPMPKVYSQVSAPVTITAGSLPIIPDEPVREWLDMLTWTKNNLDATTVVCSWWDYGYWLTIMGNVTTLVDNATINRTQIENVGFIFMSNETQALKMLKRYDAKYILVFVTLRPVSQSVISWAGFGDEGKWMWMARISGQARDRFMEEGLVNEQSGWTNESLFGNYSNTEAQQYGYGWVWNDRGQNSTLYKLMTFGAYSWMSDHDLLAYWPQQTWPTIQPEYFNLAYLAGPTDVYGYGGYIPLVCLYEIKYPST
jgi:dolichyl-diphosphooligosaccharide--protein glycosyltransferase